MKTAIGIIGSLIDTSRSYRRDLDPLGISKVWNHGMGLLPLCHLEPSTSTLYVNKLLATATDRKKLREAFAGYTWVDVEYGYPTYYFQSFLTTIRQYAVATR